VLSPVSKMTDNRILSSAVGSGALRDRVDKSLSKGCREREEKVVVGGGNAVLSGDSKGME
jgi:hypothetical protein